jgi:hypothetical protein
MRRRYRYDPNLKKLVEIVEAPARRVVPHVSGDLPAYQSPASGKWVDGRRARREDLKRTGCRPWEGLGSEKRAADAYWADIAKKSDSKLEEAAHRAWAEAPSEVRNVLGRRY